MGIQSFFGNLFTKREELNPIMFNDELAMQIAWSPLKRGGANFKTHKLVFNESVEATFTPTVMAYIFPAIFLLAALVPVFIFITDENVRENMIPHFYFIPLIPLVIGLLLFKTLNQKVVFNGMEGVFYKGKRPVVPPTEASKKYALLNDIHALQIIRERVRNSKSSYNSYELNLVLKNGKRLNVVDHGNLESLRCDTAQLASFLNVPVWDAADY